MRMSPQNILELIGNTSLLALRHVVPANGARILLKLESENPTGSMKDRMALAMIEAAEADGRLKPGGTVVEYTGGSTGVSLAFVCAVKRYPLHIVTSDAFSREKLDHMKILGARMNIIPSESGRMTEKLTRDMVEAARVIADAVQSRTPRARYLVGRDAKMMARVARFLPDRALDALIARQLGLGAPNSSSHTPT